MTDLRSMTTGEAEAWRAAVKHAAEYLRQRAKLGRRMAESVKFEGRADMKREFQAIARQLDQEAAAIAAMEPPA